MQCRSLSLAAMRPDDDLDIMIESDQEPQKPFDRELPELAPKHLRDVRLRDTEQFPGLYLFQTTLPHDDVDLVHRGKAGAKPTDRAESADPDIEMTRRKAFSGH